MTGVIHAGYGAAGQVARVVTDSGQTTCTLDEYGTGTYQLSLPEGYYCLYCQVLGYFNDMWAISVFQDRTRDFSPYPMNEWRRKIVDVAVDQTIINRDGVSTTGGTIWVRDSKGQRHVGARVSIATDRGDIVSCDAATDEYGRARFVVRSSTSPEVALLTATSGTVVGMKLVAFANLGDPVVIVTKPDEGSQVSGFMQINATAEDTEAGADAALRVQPYVDGVLMGSITTNTYRPSGLETEKLPNGWHTLKVRATDTDQNAAWSQEVHFYVYNPISVLHVSQSEIFTDDANPGNIGLTAQMNESGVWSIEVKDYYGNAVTSSSGTGNGPIGISWDGKVGGSYVPGIYTLTLAADTPGGQVTTKQYATISRTNAPVLICGAIRGEGEITRALVIDEMIGVANGCAAAGLEYTLLANPLFDADEDPNSPNPTVFDSDEDRLRRGIKYWLHRNYHYFFYTTHGAYLKYQDGVYRSSVDFFEPDGGGPQPVIGDNYWLEPRWRSIWPAFSDLGINGNQYRLVQINACWSAGTVISMDESIAHAFGNYGAVEDDQVYLGWGSPYYPYGSPILHGAQACGTEWTILFWNWLGQGYTATQSISMTNDMYGGWMHYFLWAYGGPDVTWLTW